MEKELIKLALEARKNAYAPYSNYLVGASVLTESGRMYTGCNIENASYGATNCAERTAIFKAVSEGERSIKAICIAGGKRGEEPSSYAYPCGMCRQVISEFGNDETKIIVANSETDFKVYSLKEILPFAFTKENL